VNDFYLNMSGAMIAPGNIDLLLMRSGLQWEMHPAQVFALELRAIEMGTQVYIEYDETKPFDIEDTKELFKPTPHTLMGIPVVLKQNYPMSLIRLMYEGREISRIENAAIPYGWADLANYDEWQKSEVEKFQKIGLRSKLNPRCKECNQELPCVNS
jgi:hypothetical protein